MTIPFSQYRDPWLSDGMKVISDVVYGFCTLRDLERWGGRVEWVKRKEIMDERDEREWKSTDQVKIVGGEEDATSYGSVTRSGN